MGDILKFAFSIYLFSLSFSALSGVFRFIADIKRFKEKEEKFQTVEEFENDIMQAIETVSADDLTEEGVNVDVESGEHNTPIIF